MKLTIVLPDGTRQPIEVSEQTTLRRLLPALASKVTLPRRDETGTAVAYYATIDGQTINDPLPDNETLISCGLSDGGTLILHPINIPDNYEPIELYPAPSTIGTPQPTFLPSLDGQFISRIFRLLRRGCFAFLFFICCLPIFCGTFFWTGRLPNPTLAKFTAQENGSTLWDFTPLDVAYNSFTDQILLVANHPDRLYIYEPNQHKSEIIYLSRLPTTLAIKPNSNLVAIGQPGQTTVINSAFGNRDAEVNASGKIYNIIFADNNWVYFSLTNNQERFYGVELTTRQEMSFVFLEKADERIFQLATDGRSLYGTSQGSELGRLEKIDISRGAPQFMYDSGDVADTCGEVWLAEDGRYAFTGCGHIWGLADQKKDDMVLLRNFFATPEKITALAHSTNAQRVLLIAEANDNEILMFDSDGSNLLGGESLPERAHGRYIFINAAGTQYYVIVQTDDGQFGLVTGDL